jgi:ubiquinone/menaquinone biosynthesis C-methylase UbiE
MPMAGSSGKEQNNYDPIANYYDLLSRLVFGRTEIRAQVEMLGYLQAGSRVLVVGGGTGWILEEFAAIYPDGLHITYVEPSDRMMALAKKRDWRDNTVLFVQLPVERFVTEDRYDCILTGFVFDNFCPELTEMVIGLLHPLLKDRGYWLFADFYCPKKEGKLWQQVMLRSMYLSARLILKVEASRLTDTEPLFALAGYRQVWTGFHYGRFIKSIVYQKCQE